MNAIKKLRGATAMARFIAELPDASVGMVWRKVFEGVPSPYRYSNSCDVYEWRGKNVVWFETAQGRFQVFEVPANVQIAKTERELMKGAGQ